MGNDTGAEPRGGFKVVGAGETPEDAGKPQTAGEASEPGKQPRALRPRIIVLGLGGAGGNAVHNMIEGQLEGVELFVANTDSQALETSICEHRLQLGRELTGGLGAGGRPEVGRAAAEESLDEVLSAVSGASLVFIAAGMGGGTGTGSAPVVAEAIRKKGVLTVAVVTKPFRFEGEVRMEVAEQGISALEKHVDTLIVIPNQNLFKIATEKTSVSDAFHRADNVLFAGVRGVTDLMVKPGLINLDFADFRSVMTQTGKAIMGAGEADGPQRAVNAAEAAMANPLLEDSSVDGARGVLINVTGGRDLTLFELDEAVESVRTAAHPKANIIVGSAFDEGLEGKIRVSVLATGILPKQAKAPAAKTEAADTTTAAETPAPAATAKAAEPAAKADEPAPQAAAPKAATGIANAPTKASAEVAEAAQTAERPTESASAKQAGPPAQPGSSAPTTAKAEDSAKAATPSATPPAAAEPARSEVKKADQSASTNPQALGSETTPAKTATAKAETQPTPEPAEPSIAAPEAKHADADTKEPSAEAPMAKTPAAEAPPAGTPAKAMTEGPAEAPAGGGHLTLEDILKRAEQAMESQKAAEAAAAETAEASPPPAPDPAVEVAAQPPFSEPKPIVEDPRDPAPAQPEPAAKVEAPSAAPQPRAAPAEAAPDDDANLDALIDEVLIRNRKTAELEPAEPSLRVPPARAPEGPDPGGTSTDALLEDLAFSLASDDPFVLDQPAAERGTEDKDLEALFGAPAAGTPDVVGEAAQATPEPSSDEDSEDAFQAELDRRARERARAALEALSEPSGGEPKAKPKPEEEDSDEALREIMNIPSFLRRTDD